MMMTNRFIKIGAAAENYVLKLAVGVELLKNLCCYQSAFSIANIATSVATET